jgi:tetratricopeptide (TPR) repeat protein
VVEIPNEAPNLRPVSKIQAVAVSMLKIVGAATAVLSLGAALYGLGHFLYGVRHDSRAVADLIVIAKNQQDREQFRDAWATLAEASKIEQTSIFVIDIKMFHQAKENLGMAWLENIRIREGETFTSIVAMIEPVLDRGQLSAGPQRQADLLAYIGWAAFLRSREQGTSPDVAERAYRKAIAADPANPYANAMLGHWIMWHVRDLDAASPYFATAVASGRAAGFVRGLQLAALHNDHTAEADLEQIRVVNAMRKEASQSRLVEDRANLWGVYYSFFRADAGEYAIERILSIVPPEEHLLTFHWLFDRARFDGGKELMRICYVGLLLEASGRREEALETFNGLQRKLNPSGSGYIPERVQSAIRRLSGATP